MYMENPTEKPFGYRLTNAGRGAEVGYSGTQWHHRALKLMLANCIVGRKKVLSDHFNSNPSYEVTPPRL